MTHPIRIGGKDGILIKIINEINKRQLKMTLKRRYLSGV